MYAKLDAETIAALERQGADLSRPLAVDHFIESLDERSANAVATELHEHGFAVTVLPPQPEDEVHHWGVQATLRMTVDEETVARVRAELTSLAERSAVFTTAGTRRSSSVAVAVAAAESASAARILRVREV